jgi:peptidoglycan/LPS O-acetylase OafA/YrhL
VDGLRALAVVAVIVNHLEPSWWPLGYLGVDVFFVISGFVVTLSLLSRPLDHPGAFLWGFYSRRVRRLMPLLVLTVLTTSLLAALVMYPGSLERVTSLQTGIAALVGGSNLFLLSQNSDYFGISAELNLFLHTWSLGVEEQFYLVFPLLWLLGRGGSHKRLAVVIALLCCASALLQAHLLGQSQGFNASFYLMPARFWEIGLGVLLALALPRLQPWLQRLRPALALGLAPWLLVALLVALVQGLGTVPYLQGPSVVLLTALLLLALEARGPIQRGLSFPVLLAVGLRSYGLYLWHWPLLVLLRWTLGVRWWTALLAVLLTVALAWLTYRWIESPLRRRRWRPRARGELALGGAGAGLAAAGLGLLMTPALAEGWWLGRAQPKGYIPPVSFPHMTYAPEVPGTGINRQACFERFSFTSAVQLRPEDLQRCRVAPQRPGAPTIYVYGDSFAGHLSPLLIQLRRDYGVGLEVLIRAQCPFPTRRSDPSDDCTRFHAERRERVLTSAKPGDVLLLATSAREPGGHYTEFFMQQLGEVSRTLTARGVRVIMQSPLPRFPGSFDPICVYPLQRFQPGAAQRCATPTERSRNEELERTGPLLAQLESLRAADGLELWDAFGVLCPADQARCSTHQGDVRLFRDEAHLSARGAEHLMPSLRTVLFPGGAEEARTLPRREGPGP